MKTGLQNKIFFIFVIIVGSAFSALYVYLRMSSPLTKSFNFYFLFLFCIVVLAGYIASFFISKPVKEISAIAQDIANKNLSRRMLVKSEDEIGALARSFNYIMDEMKGRIDEVIESKTLLETVFFSMFDGVMVVDAKGKILLMNQSLKNFLKIEDDPAGKLPVEVIRNADVQRMVEEILNSTRNFIVKEISFEVEEEKIFLIHATPVRREGKTYGAVLVFHDITELRRLEKIRQDFVANASHELRTPVTNIKGYAETLLEGAMEDRENAQRFLKVLLTEANRLTALINDLLDLTKIETGDLKLNLRPVDLKEVAEKVIFQLKRQAEEKSVEINMEISEGLSKVKADEKKMGQILANLIDNAIKYNRIGGKVRITAKETDDFVRVEISDTGIGIPEKDLPRIFERFYRVDKVRSRELGGTGLGLSIVKHLVHKQGGEIDVESKEGAGSTFSFTIPRA